MNTEFGQRFPRLESLRKEEVRRDGVLRFFRCIPDRLVCALVPHLANDVYMRLETDLAELDERNWDSFQTKLFSKHSDEAPHPIRGYSSLFSTLNEAKAYRVLKEHAFGAIELIDEGQTRSPDWRANDDNGNVVLLEVKTVLQSDDEVNFVHRNTEALEQGHPPRIGRLSPEMTDGFKNKIRADIASADQQMETYAQTQNLKDYHKMVLVVAELDFDLSSESRSFRQAREFIQSIGSDTLQVVTEFVGIQWPIDEPASV